MKLHFELDRSKYLSTAAYNKAYREGYSAWSIDLIKNKGFAVSVKDIMKRLHVSKYWIDQHIIHNENCNVDYFEAFPSALSYLGIRDKSLLYFNEQQLRQYLFRAAEFSRWTNVIDLSRYMSQKALYEVDSNPAILNWDTYHKHVYGKRSERVLELLEDKFENADETERNKYNIVNVPPFDFWEKELSFLSEFPNNETGYRYFFRHGTIKINLFGKALFVIQEDLDKLSYPLTVALSIKEN